VLLQLLQVTAVRSEWLHSFIRLCLLTLELKHADGWRDGEREWGERHPHAHTHTHTPTHTCTHAHTCTPPPPSLSLSVFWLYALCKDCLITISCVSNHPQTNQVSRVMLICIACDCMFQHKPAAFNGHN